MTYTQQNPPWATPNTGPAKVVADDAFKLTALERGKIKIAIEAHWPLRVDDSTLEELTDRIESIINEGWQTCV